MRRVDAKERITKTLVRIFLKFTLDTENEDVACEIGTLGRGISLVLVIDKFPLRLKCRHPAPGRLSVVRI